MQDMVEELDDLRRKRIYNEDEIREIVKKRRDFEYLLQKIPTKPQYFLSYVRYEVAVECLRGRRSKRLGWRTKTISDHSGIRRLHFIFDRAVRRHRGNKKLWYQYIDFCLRSGSFKVFSTVLFRALKYHPKEVHIWLLAADNELRLNRVNAARSLLMRAIRCVPKSAKLWGEFLRLELQIGGRLWALRDNKGDMAGPMLEELEEKPTADPWAPARLVLQRAVSKLSNKPGPCATFFNATMPCIRQSLKAVRSDDDPETGMEELASELRTALAEHRPGVAEKGAMWAEVSEEVTMTLWRLWWEFERAHSTDWKAIAEAAAGGSPPSALRLLASTLAASASRGSDDGEEAAEALVQLVGSSRAKVDAETVLALLEVLDSCGGFVSEAAEATKEAMAAAAEALLSRGAAAHPSSSRLQLLAWKDSGSTKSLEQIVKDASAMDAEEAVGLRLVTRPAFVASSSSAMSEPPALETLLRRLVASAAARPLLTAHLSEAFAAGGQEAFRVTCDEVREVASRIWDLPQRRVEVLAAVLDAELRCCGSVLSMTDGTGTVQLARRLGSYFEDILASVKDEDAEKEEWWIRYLEFVQRYSRWGFAAGGSGLPNTTDLHWRALRSVANQARYLEKAHRLLQAQFPGAG